MTSTLPILRNNLDGTVTVMQDCQRAHGPAIPAGTVSNGANIPWLLRRFWPAWGGWYDRAVIGHDRDYQLQDSTRKEADERLWRNMDADSDEALRDKSMLAALPFCLWAGLTCAVFYYAVRLCGWWRWGRGRKC